MQIQPREKYRACKEVGLAVPARHAAPENTRGTGIAKSHGRAPSIAQATEACNYDLGMRSRHDEGEVRTNQGFRYCIVPFVCAASQGK